MSYNIKLHVLDSRHERLDRPDTLTSEDIYPHTTLMMGQDYRVLGQIIDLSMYRDRDDQIPVKPFVPSFELPDDVAIRRYSDNAPATRMNNYDEVMRWAFAKDLAEIRPSADFEGDLNVAVKAYLGAISGDTSVVIETL